MYALVMERKRYDTDLTDAGWAELEPHIPPAKTRPRQINPREIMNALLYMQKTGCPWRLLPHDFPHWSAVRYYFDQWKKKGVWEQINAALSQKERQRQGKEPDPSVVIVDSQSVKTTVTGCTSGYDAGKKNTGHQASGRSGHVGADCRIGHPASRYTGSRRRAGGIGAGACQ